MSTRTFYRLWTWANQQNSNCGLSTSFSPFPPGPAPVPGLPWTVENCVHVMHSHPFITYNELSGRTTAFGVLDPCKYAVFACYPKCSECPKCTRCILAKRQRQQEKERKRVCVREHASGILYFILPNEQTSCRTRKQMALLV